MKKTEKRDTSWGKEAEWYADHLSLKDTYHSKVILPNLLRVISPHANQYILEIGCGEGFFSRALQHAGASVVACDISPELIEIGKQKGGSVEYHVSKAENLEWLQPKRYDVVFAVLTLQNMEKIEPVFQSLARVLKNTGRFIFVLNHPAFRIPKVTSWCFDDRLNVQYRRVDSYLSSRREKLDMHPGSKGEKSFTYSFHRSLQDYLKALRTSGFAVVGIEEWISHRVSGHGPRAKAENKARKEFPLFMMVECTLNTKT